MTSIFDDRQLIESLLKIAQAKPPTNLYQLKNTALKMIDNLKASLSPAKANSNPSFLNLRDLRSFSEWAKDSNATFNGHPVIDTNAESMKGFLIDLRQKAAGQKGLYGEAIANLISSLNSKFGTKIDAYEPAAKPGVPDNAVANKPGPGGSKMLALKVGPNGVDDGTSRPGQPGQSGPAMQQAVKSGGLSILNGSTVNFDEIYERSTLISTYISRLNTNWSARAWAALNTVSIRMANKKGSFDSITHKTPGLNMIGCSPTNDGPEVMGIIENSFNDGINQEQAKQNNSPQAYRFDELASIASYFAALMVEIKTFYSILLTIPDFSQDPETSQVLRKQSEWANAYQINFTGAHEQFVVKNNRWSRAK